MTPVAGYAERTVPDRKSSELFDGVLMLVELTELGQRVPAGAREHWALDCAKRAIGDDIPALRPHRAVLRTSLSAARSRLTVSSTETREEFDRAQQHASEALDELQERFDEEGPGLGRARAVEAARSLLAAMRCVDGHREHEAAARVAQGAFEDPLAEADNQARRLLQRCKLIPTGAELLVRLDYAEDHGAMPKDPRERAWLDAQRELLMNEDQERRMAVVFRHLHRVFLAELSRSR